ncbi:MAG: YybH family protein [Gemmatimonadota bacterium]
MAFDPELFLARYAAAYNAHDPETLRSLFALDDARFAVFEDFSGTLFDGEGYGVVLEAVFDATAEMSFEVLRCDTFGELAAVHAIQKIVDRDESGAIAEALVRSTLLVSTAGREPRVVSAHFSLLPAADEACCDPGACRGHE